FVDRKSGIRVNDLIAFFNQREDGEKNDGFTAGDNDYFFWGCVYPARLTDVLSDDFGQLRHAGRRPVMGEAFVQSVGRRVNDVARGIEIGLADLEMDDVAACCLQRSRLHQHFESGLGAETRHALGEPDFVAFSHDSEMKIIARWRNLSLSDAY